MGKLWPVDRFDKARHTARTKAGIGEAGIFHGFRQTLVRNMTRAGVPEKSPCRLPVIRPVPYLIGITSPI